MSSLTEKPAFCLNGFLVLGVELLLLALSIGGFIHGAAHPVGPEMPGATFWMGMGLILVFSLVAAGFFTVQPNQARAIIFFGTYVGTVREQGFFWTNPLTLRKPISLRMRNFNSERLKVNDATGNPIEIAVVVNWRVVDSARALFEVDQYESYVNIQTETAIRGQASRFPYDAHETGEHSLRGNSDEVSAALRAELQGRLLAAGVEVLDVRISHLAYAAEIAQAMLRRQQAQAIIAARQQIVEGAVGMVEMALRRLSEHKVIELDEERKASMVSNLLVVLVSESDAQPVINAGSLY